MASSRHRILFLDAYDSFSNNITALLATLLDVDVFVLPIHAPHLDPSSAAFTDALRHELAHYDAVVCGPGPGSPDNERDVGLVRHVLALGGDGDGDALLPVLGVCLGFQCLAVSCGAAIRRLRRGLHGMVRPIDHRGLEGPENSDVFAGVGAFSATLYHSLCVDVGQDEVPKAEWSLRRWESPDGCLDVVPLAWTEEERDSGVERVLTAMRHRRKPFWGLQYHPESVCTLEEGNQVIRNWFGEALRWNRERRRTVVRDGHLRAADATRPSLLSQLALRNDSRRCSTSSTRESLWTSFGADFSFVSETIALPDQIQVPDIVEILEARDAERIVLDSATAADLQKSNTGADVRGRYSIIALDVAESLHLEYHAGDTFATAKLPSVMGLSVNLTETISLDNYASIWQLIAAFQAARHLDPEVSYDTPFLGGFMGYITYEQGLAGIGVGLAEDRSHSRPDICLVWITRSIVIDHAERLLHVQQLRPRGSNDDSFIRTISTKLQASHFWQHLSCSKTHDAYKWKRDAGTLSSSPKTPPATWETRVRAPNPAGYEAKVLLCQEYIAAGDSYELCLTDQTTITRPRSDPPTPAATYHTNSGHLSHRKRRQSLKLPGSWQLFRTLRARQPAPFASYLRLGGATLVSASPERFLQHRDGLCSMRPMKGTVRKSAAVATVAAAERVLHVPKERAENLMIVDLVRHDLHSICGPGNVRVPALMRVEEYRSVFQMVTVVEGLLPKPSPGREAERYTGLDVLAASLPPGSMTGAPKRRSCEILQEIEGGKERSLYSGVVGYMDIRGRGDWSVTIRSMFRWDDEQAEAGDDGVESGPLEVWHIGAGGAVTILSTAEGEREEMFTKLAGPLGVFSESG